MQLSKLNSAIREADPGVKVRFSFGDVQLHRPTLLEALKTHFGGVRTAETGLTIVDGYLQFTSRQDIDATGRATDFPPPATEQVADDDDLSSLA